jgi:hypothetical protein
MKRSKTKTIGQGWVGRWRDGTLGWFLPNHCSGYKNGADRWNDDPIIKDEKVYLCSITIKQKFKKNGSPITRVVKS